MNGDRMPRKLRNRLHTEQQARCTDPGPAGHRAPIGLHALHAAFAAHLADHHRPYLGRDCHVCTAYSDAVTRAQP